MKLVTGQKSKFEIFSVFLFLMVNDNKLERINADVKGKKNFSKSMVFVPKEEFLLRVTK